MHWENGSFKTLIVFTVLEMYPRFLSVTRGTDDRYELSISLNSASPHRSKLKRSIVFIVLEIDIFRDPKCMKCHLGHR